MPLAFVVFGDAFEEPFALMSFELTTPHQLVDLLAQLVRQSDPGVNRVLHDVRHVILRHPLHVRRMSRVPRDRSVKRR